MRRSIERFDDLLDDAIVPCTDVVPRDAVRSSPLPDRLPEVWAIVVGVDNYTDPAIPGGTTAVRNAQRGPTVDPTDRLGRRAPGLLERRW